MFTFFRWKSYAISRELYKLISLNIGIILSSLTSTFLFVFGHYQKISYFNQITIVLGFNKNTLPIELYPLSSLFLTYVIL